MNTGNQVEEDHRARSNFVKGLIQGSVKNPIESPTFGKKIPKTIVQFWDNLDRLPGDVSECIDSWRAVEELGIEKILFDSHQAKEFIRKRLGVRHEQAYDKCYHPAMQSDYFRLCYIFIEGGCYVDADDVYTGHSILDLFDDGRLKVQPLCYDISTDSMVSPSQFTKPNANEDNWIFYFNNNPLISSCKHPLIERALNQATSSLEVANNRSLPEIQSTTGPGNLTRSIFEIINHSWDVRSSLLILENWENIAQSRWDLSYRKDARNWRLSNRRFYQ